MDEHDQKKTPVWMNMKMKYVFQNLLLSSKHENGSNAKGKNVQEGKSKFKNQLKTKKQDQEQELRKE